MNLERMLKEGADELGIKLNTKNINNFIIYLEELNVQFQIRLSRSANLFTFSGEFPNRTWLWFITEKHTSRCLFSGEKLFAF